MVQRRCRGAGEAEQRWWSRGGAEVQSRCFGAEMQRAVQ